MSKKRTVQRLLTSLLLGFMVTSLAVLQEVRATPKQVTSAVKKETPGKPKQLYMRLLRDANEKPLALQTSIIRFVYKDA